MFARRDPAAELGGAGMGGTFGDWLPGCAAALAAKDETALRRVLEGDFLPVQVFNNEQQEGLFTGYYEPVLKGSRRRSDRCCQRLPWGA